MLSAKMKEARGRRVRFRGRLCGGELELGEEDDDLKQEKNVL